MSPQNRSITARVEAHGRYDYRRKVIWRRENGYDLSWHAIDMEGEHGIAIPLRRIRGRLCEDAGAQHGAAARLEVLT